MIRRSAVFFVLVVSFALASVLSAQPTVSPGVGNAVLLAKNSIQLDSGVVVTSGDIVVNEATSSPVYGELALSVDRTATTPAGYKLAATSIDIDGLAVIGGDVYYNTLSNQGTIAGSQFTPLSLPVYATLPPSVARSAGSQNITVAPFGTLTLGEGSYGSLVVGRGAVLTFSGGGYAFASISADRDSQLRFSAPSDVVVNGRVLIGRDAIVGPATSSSITAASIRIQADGINGTDGALLSTPRSFELGNGVHVSANLHASAGSLVFGSGNTADGAFFARDILVGRDGHCSLNSYWNQPPTANPQTVFTSGTTPLVITLTGSDPEGRALTFSIVSGPSAGNLTSPVQASPTSATVTYTPFAADTPDEFTFRVTDTGGKTGDAVVRINPVGGDPPPPATTVVANDGSGQTTKDASATMLMTGDAPSGVSLTFSIVANSGPSHGSLSSVTQGPEVPQRTATVVYTPDSGYTGSDSFQFEACGVISGNPVCDTATLSITVLEARPDPSDPNIVNDVETSTFVDDPVDITLGPTSASFSRRIEIKPTAAVLEPATIAGNTADADNNGFGDNHNALPGSTPVFVSAGIGQSGGAGSNGTARIHMEFNISSYVSSVNQLQSAVVTLPTHRGTSDSVDTFMYWASGEGDGALSDSDFESSAEVLPGAVMQVPSLSVMPLGSDGTFSFGVLDQVRTTMQAGNTYFVVQGRVNESQGGTVRGLEVRTTASGNLPSNVPSLTLTTPGITAPYTYTITSLASSGTLYDGNTLITSTPYQLPGTSVRYVPNTSFVGDDSFTFTASDGQFVDTALVTVRVRLAACASDVEACNNGR